MLEISKDRSSLIKGIVILMMIFLHLFNNNQTDLCYNLFYIGDIPLVKWLSRACGPVSFFVLLSGYGLAYTYEHGELVFGKQLKRIFKLYFHYWIVLGIFLFIGWYLYPEKYPGTWNRIFGNITGWQTNYNHAMWFLFPYMLVSLTSYYIIRTVEKIGYIKAVVITSIVYFCACYIISRFHATILDEYQLLNLIVVYIQFIYPFTLGVAFCRANITVNLRLPTWAIWTIMLCAIIMVAIINVSVTYIVYVPLMVFLFCQLNYYKMAETVLIELGRKSMPMWMIHTWYCNYLFHDQVYSLKYPLLIFIFVVLISYLSAIPIMWIGRKCFGYMKI